MELKGRELEIAKLKGFLLPSYNSGLMVPFISIYGKSGTGKSAVVKAVCDELQKKDLLLFKFVTLRKARTVFGCANAILHELGGGPLKSADGMSVEIEHIEQALLSRFGDHHNGEGNTGNANGSKNRPFVLILDEFDALFSHSRRNDASDFIFSLMIIEEEIRKDGQTLCIIAISNKIVSDYSRLDDRVRSRIGNSQIYFPSYNIEQLVKILDERQNLAFSRPADLKVIEYCAKMCSQDHGDARRAIDLLRMAAEIALEKNQSSVPKNNGKAIATISNEDVDLAFDETQRENIDQEVKNLPKQLFCIIAALSKLDYLTDGEWQSTTTLLSRYRAYAFPRHHREMKMLTRRRFAEAMMELENLGLVESRRKSEGRHGYHAEYRLIEDSEIIGKTCFEDSDWQEIVDLKVSRLHFLHNKQLRRIWSEFEKNKRTLPNYYDVTIATEMNDDSWNLLVYGRPIVK